MLKFYLRNFVIPPLIYNFLGSLKYKLFSKNLSILLSFLTIGKGKI